MFNIRIPGSWVLLGEVNNHSDEVAQLFARNHGRLKTRRFPVQTTFHLLLPQSKPRSMWSDYSNSTELICVTSPGSVAVKLSSTSELWSRAETRSRLSRPRITKPLGGKDHEDQREAWRATNQHPSCPRHLLIRWMCRLSREQSVI